MNIKNMTKEDFDNISLLPNLNIGDFDSVVIIPTGEMHDSGYMTMYFALIDKDGEPIGKISGISDIIHLDGIGGLGKNWLETGGVPSNIGIKAWKIDCLPCGYLRLFSRGKLSCDNWVMSNFNVYSDTGR